MQVKCCFLVVSYRVLSESNFVDWERNASKFLVK